MKPRLQATLGQHLVMTPQLQQAIRLLQLSAAELDVELASAVESNPLLDWSEPSQVTATGGEIGPARVDGDDRSAAPAEADWGGSDGEPWYERVGPSDRDDEGPLAEQVAETETLHDHLLWQLHLSPLSPRDRLIAV
ncbi:MAG TPA: RNA polymerase factor sigma-54, partial [Lysobacter sp.]|nr:RNA polymerase factor sigma-54 [Lysobacter sp.]